MAKMLGQTRTTNDVVALCVELLRAVREQEYQTRDRGHTPPGRAPSVDRAWRAWRADLDRNGSLQLFTDLSGLRVEEFGVAVGRGRLDELAGRFSSLGLPWVAFEPGLDAPTWAALVSLLVADPAQVAANGGATAFLPERGVGIRLPEAPTRAPGLAAPVAATADTLSNDETQPVVDVALSRGGGPAASALDRLRAGVEDSDYTAVVANVVRDAIEASDADDAESCHEAVRLLAEHASARGGRSETQRKTARDALGELCTGKRLADWIERATSSDAEENRRFTGILLQLAGEVAPALLSAIDVQEDGPRREELLGITIALGRAATPALRRAMEGSSPARAQVAARIAGEIRDERAVPALSKLLEHPEADVRSEAARALARIGDERALAALSTGLASVHDDVATLCAYCLGVTGRPEAADALTESLRRARRARRIGLASAVIRSLGRLGREESVPELRRILEKRSFFRRQELQELKLQALAALARLPGEPARTVLSDVAAGSDVSLAVAARRAMHAAEDEEG